MPFSYHARAAVRPRAFGPRLLTRPRQRGNVFPCSTAFALVLVVAFVCLASLARGL